MANYDNVNAVWPENPSVPSPQEALTGARKLVRLALSFGPQKEKFGRPWKFTGKFKLTSGNRYTWTKSGVFYVNPDRRESNVGRGWQTIVHNIAHWAGRRLYPNAAPHDARVAFIERKLAEHVVQSGWLDGKLAKPSKVKPPETAADKQAARLAKTDAQIAGWERKERRVKNALRKLRKRRKQQARYLLTADAEAAKRAAKRAAAKARKLHAGKGRVVDLSDQEIAIEIPVATRNVDLD